VPCLQCPGRARVRRPPSLSHQSCPPRSIFRGLRDENLIDLTPELRKEAMINRRQYDHGPCSRPGGLAAWHYSCYPVSAAAAIGLVLLRSTPEPHVLCRGPTGGPFVVTPSQARGRRGRRTDFIVNSASLVGAARVAVAQKAAVRQHRLARCHLIDLNCDHRFDCIPFWRRRALPVIPAFHHSAFRPRTSGIFVRIWACDARQSLSSCNRDFLRAIDCRPGAPSGSTISQFAIRI